MIRLVVTIHWTLSECQAFCWGFSYMLSHWATAELRQPWAPNPASSGTWLLIIMLYSIFEVISKQTDLLSSVNSVKQIRNHRPSQGGPELDCRYIWGTTRSLPAVLLSRVSPGCYPLAGWNRLKGQPKLQMEFGGMKASKTEGVGGISG